MGKDGQVRVVMAGELALVTDGAGATRTPEARGVALGTDGAGATWSPGAGGVALVTDGAGATQTPEAGGVALVTEVGAAEHPVIGQRAGHTLGDDFLAWRRYGTLVGLLAILWEWDALLRTGVLASSSAVPSATAS